MLCVWGAGLGGNKVETKQCAHPTMKNNHDTMPPRIFRSLSGAPSRTLREMDLQMGLVITQGIIHSTLKYMKKFARMVCGCTTFHNIVCCVATLCVQPVSQFFCIFATTNQPTNQPHGLVYVCANNKKLALRRCRLVCMMGSTFAKTAARLVVLQMETQKNK